MCMITNPHSHAPTSSQKTRADLIIIMKAKSERHVTSWTNHNHVSGRMNSIDIWTLDRFFFQEDLGVISLKHSQARKTAFTLHQTETRWDFTLSQFLLRPHPKTNTRVVNPVYKSMKPGVAWKRGSSHPSVSTNESNQEAKQTGSPARIHLHSYLQQKRKSAP